MPTSLWQAHPGYTWSFGRHEFPRGDLAATWSGFMCRSGQRLRGLGEYVVFLKPNPNPNHPPLTLIWPPRSSANRQVPLFWNKNEQLLVHPWFRASAHTSPHMLFAPLRRVRFASEKVVRLASPGCHRRAAGVRGTVAGGHSNSRRGGESVLDGKAAYCGSGERRQALPAMAATILPLLFHRPSRFKDSACILFPGGLPHK